MADPFAVELPRQMQIDPVDMSGMKYVGRNVASWFQGNPEMEMRKARVNAELAQVQSQIESQKINNDIKAFELRQKMQSDREIAQIHLETGGDPEKVVNFQVKTTNPYTIRALSQMKLGAAKALASGAMAKQETQILSGLSDLLTKGDADSANDAGEIMRGIREQRGIKADHITAYQNAASAFNQRKAVLDAKEKEKSFVPTREGKWLREAEELEAEGKTELAKDFRALISKAAKSKEAIPVKTVTVTEQDPTTGRKMTRRLTESEAANEPPVVDAETQKFLKQYAEEKAALQSGDKSVGPDWMGLGDRARKLSELDAKIKQKGIDPDTGRRLLPSTTTQTTPTRATSPKRPTKAIAADYVQRLGREKAIEALKQEGYDLSGYAD